ncbi:MAG: hypothetical protein WBG71_13045 [Leeuwenhoekiella sp.]
MSKLFSNAVVAALCILPLGNFLSAQSMIDGFFSKKGELSLTASYTSSTFEEFYLGEELQPAVPAHNEISQNIYSLYAKYALSDDFSVILSLPYFSSNGDGAPDPVNGETEQKDFQDISLYAKYRLGRVDLESGNIDFLSALGFNIPTGYEPNGILSNGNGAFATNLHLGAQWNTGSGFFTSAIFGYSLRGKADNNFGVNGGDDFDVPNAFLSTGKIGYATESFYIDAYVNYQGSSDGVDIGGTGFAGNFPETQVDFTVLGTNAYVPVGDTLGLSAGYGFVVNGRNLGDASIFSLGATFVFGGE